MIEGIEEQLGDYFEQFSPEEKNIRNAAFFSILKGIPATLNYLHQETNMPK
ncbi:hypothetical protein [Sporosalibacterium faouarense]|jgi:hypothetical protein|uniref:hypothetical protein n=1 Tax=Sporosalibacterium faouarense TaxID=516123 RepID=UPI00192CC255|nr:hypothetical protein [Sporosalibacterium faouarense]